MQEVILRIIKNSNTLVIHANGAVKKSLDLGLFTISPKVKPGSIIKVVDDKTVEIEKKPLDWNVAIEKTMLKLTGIISLYLLIDRLAVAQ